MLVVNLKDIEEVAKLKNLTRDKIISEIDKAPKDKTKENVNVLSKQDLLYILDKHK